MRFGVPDQDRRAAGVDACLDICYAVADHHASMEVYVPSFRCCQQHARTGLAAGTSVCGVMWTAVRVISRDRRGYKAVDRVHHALPLRAPRNVRLIGDDHEQ